MNKLPLLLDCDTGVDDAVGVVTRWVAVGVTGGAVVSGTAVATGGAVVSGAMV